MDYSNLLTFVRTKSEAYDFVAKLDIVVSSFYDKKKNPRTVLSEVFSRDKKTLIESLCEQETVNLDDPVSFATFVADVKKYIDSLKTVLLTLAFEPSANVLEKIADQITKGLSSGVIIDLRIDKGIIGGAIIEFAGRRRDYSVRKKLLEKLDSKKNI